jgi:hypothetical protein
MTTRKQRSTGPELRHLVSGRISATPKLCTQFDNEAVRRVSEATKAQTVPAATVPFVWSDLHKKWTSLRLA